MNDATGSSIAAVSANQYLETGVSYSTLTAPSTFSAFRFTHWTNSSAPSTVYRDAWGRSLNPISLVLLEDTTCTAHYLPATLDSDGDGVPDWYKLEYFGTLDVAASSDTDGDGFTLLEEFQNGTHPLYGNSNQVGGIAHAASGMVTFNRESYSTYTLRSEPAGTVNQSTVVPPGTLITSPNLTQSTFGYWTLDGVPQRDAWGVALRQISFTMSDVDREAVAWFFTGDADGDGLPDAWEWYYLGTTAHDGSADLNGDGFTLLQNHQAGRAPTFAYAHQAGGVSWADSAMVTVNLAGFSRYTLASDPPGTVNQSAIVADGTVITTPDMSQASFGYWTLDGVAQRDSWGAALRQLSFTVDGADRTAVAQLFSGDTDGDGIPDAWEQYHFGSLGYGAQDAPAGGGWTLQAAYQAGASPLFPQSHQAGGVSWADSEMVVVNLQPFERLGRILIDGVLTDFFSPDPHSVTGIQVGEWASTAVPDWDGDGAFDLFVADQNGLRVFRNIGTARNPNFREIHGGFTALAALIAAIDRPVIAGGDWNGDGLGDLVIGGHTGTLRLVASSGVFGSDAGGHDLTVPGTLASPALADMNGDGLADLLVLLDDGTVTLFLNNGTPTPFSGGGIANVLGLAAPDGISIACGDVNQDGLPDVLLADRDGRIWEFINNGAGFSLQSKVWGGSFPGFASGLTLAAVDLEGDGDLDLIAGLANGGLIALRDPRMGRPTGLFARPGANSVRLDWDPTWQTRIRGYHVYRADDPLGPWSRLNADYVPLPSYLDEPVAPSVLHHYQVTGVSYFFRPGNSTPQIIESLPSESAAIASGKVILTLRPARGVRGRLARFNLSIENSTGVSGEGMDIRMSYNPTKLTPWAQARPNGKTVLTTGLSENLTLTDNGAVANGALVIQSSAGLLEPGAGKLFTVQFEVAADVEMRTPLGLTITNAAMRDQNGRELIIEIRYRGGLIADDVYFEGDINGDGVLSMADKDLMQELTKRMSRPPTADELAAGDLNGDGILDFRDLVLLLQMLNQP